MDGIIMFFTILTALGLGYSRGLNTKKKKIYMENNQLKKELTILKSEVKKLKFIKYDYQIEHGLFKKKGENEFKNDMGLIVHLDNKCLNHFISLFGLLSIDEVNLNKKIDLCDLEKYLRNLELKKDIIELNISGTDVVVDVWSIDNDLKTLFNQYINMSEYDMTNGELKDALEEKIEEILLKSPKKIFRAVARDYRKKRLP